VGIIIAHLGWGLSSPLGARPGNIYTLDTFT
jgi:hypothetical protein